MTGDSNSDVEQMALKISKIRIFNDEKGKMNKSVLDIGGEALVVSQFTLAADTSRGNRPGFSYAAPPDEGRRLYEKFVEEFEKNGINMIIYANHLFRSTYPNMKATAESILRNKRSKESEKNLMLTLAASIEQESRHPLAQAIIQEAQISVRYIFKVLICGNFLLNSTPNFFLKKSNKIKFKLNNQNLDENELNFNTNYFYNKQDGLFLPYYIYPKTYNYRYDDLEKLKKKYQKN